MKVQRKRVDLVKIINSIKSLVLVIFLVPQWQKIASNCLIFKKPNFLPFRLFDSKLASYDNLSLTSFVNKEKKKSLQFDQKLSEEFMAIESALTNCCLGKSLCHLLLYYRQAYLLSQQKSSISAMNVFQIE